MSDLIVFSTSGAVKIPERKGLLAIGGNECTGVKVPGLKHSDSYAVVGETDGKVAVHVLRGKRKGQVMLERGNVLTVEDLTLCLLDRDVQEENDDDRLHANVQGLVRRFAGNDSLTASLQGFLKNLLDMAEMDKGVLIARDSTGKLHAFAKAGVKEGETWLSEGIVQEALTSGRSLWIHNRIGSAFESSKSLIAAGFLSVFALPLVARGEILGAVLIGSNRPHSGLDARRREKLETIAQIGALLFWFHQRDEAARREIERLSLAQEKAEQCPLVTASARLEHEIEIARRVAGTRLGVLIQGETGVGKEVMARWIHQESDRRGGPFVAINCGAIPAELLESILFGHKRGAFTGAISDQIGKFQQAHGGTLLLDEVGDLPERLQVKLLRVLQEGTIDPIGSQKPVKIDVRVLAATHRNVSELVKRGVFRQDLYFRVAETAITIPPLRERPEDVALLATQFLRAAAPEKKLSPATLTWLAQQAWPGNVRELQSSVRRAAALGGGHELTPEMFLLGLPQTGGNETLEPNWLGGSDLEEARQKFVQEKIRLALERSGGNRQQAAELLGVTARTLFRYLEDARNSGQNIHNA